MPTLDIGGRKVTVGDDFLKLSPEQQNATVEEISESLAKQPAPEPLPKQAAPAASAPQSDQPWTTRLREAIHAPTRALTNQFTFGLGDRIRAGMDTAIGAGNYADNLKAQHAETDRFRANSPVMAPIVESVGAVATPLAAIGAMTKGAKTLYSMGAGAGVSGVQSGFESRDWTNLPQTGMDIAKGAGIGGGIGAVIPGGGNVIGAGFNYVADAFNGRVPGMSRTASGHLVDAMRADGPAAVLQRLAQLGDDAMLVDAGPAFLGKGQGASLLSDDGRSIMQNALSARNDATNQRIMGDVNRALGPAEDPQTVTNAIRSYRSEVDGINYPAAFANAPAVDTSNVLTELGSMIGRSVGLEQRALTNLREMLMMHAPNGRVVAQSNAEVLHKIKGELDNVIKYDAPGLGLPAAALSRQQGALRHMRGLVNEALERQVPGYAEANRVSAGLARRGDAVQLGTQYLGNGKTTASPDRFAHEFTQLTPGEQIAFGKGSRGNIDRSLGIKANDLVALRQELQGEGGWNTAKLATVHGQQAAEDLVASVERNLKFRDTHNKIVENSQTEMRRSAREAMKPTPATQSPFLGPQSTMTGMTVTAAKKGVSAIWDALARRDPTASYGDVARSLSLQGRAMDVRVQEIIDALERRTRNTARGAIGGDRAALIAAIAAHGAAQNDRRRRHQ